MTLGFQVSLCEDGSWEEKARRRGMLIVWNIFAMAESKFEPKFTLRNSFCQWMLRVKKN